MGGKRDDTRLEGCNLKAIDFPLEKFTALKELNLSSNDNLKSLPASIAHLIAFRNLSEVHFDIPVIDDLDWAGANLSSISSPTFARILTKMPRLKRVNLSGNYLTEVSDTLKTFKVLRSLDLSNNRLRKVPKALYQDFPFLSFVNLRENAIENLTGHFADWALNMKADMRVLFGYNPVHVIKWVYSVGALPPEMGLLTDLEHLQLDGNR